MNLSFKNELYDIYVTPVASPEKCFAELEQKSYDVVILDTCFRGSNSELTNFDLMHFNLQQEYYGPDIYRKAKSTCPDALVIIISNLPVKETRTAFDYMNAEYFSKADTSPENIAAYVKNYFDTERKRFLNNVFIVYGHDMEMKEQVQQYLHELGIYTVDLLTVSPNGICTLFDALKICATKIECAIILLSSDDILISDIKGENPLVVYQPRQNVIFEMGLFAGILGRDKVITIYKPQKNFQFPSDIGGIYYTEFTENNQWKKELRTQLIKIGFRAL